MCKWLFSVLTHLVTSQGSFHVDSNVAMANTRHAGSMFIWSKVVAGGQEYNSVTDAEVAEYGFSCIRPWRWW